MAFSGDRASGGKAIDEGPVLMCGSAVGWHGPRTAGKKKGQGNSGPFAGEMGPEGEGHGLVNNSVVVYW
jgi:hypothetical protein